MSFGEKEHIKSPVLGQSEHTHTHTLTLAHTHTHMVTLGKEKNVKEQGGRGSLHRQPQSKTQ